MTLFFFFTSIIFFFSKITFKLLITQKQEQSNFCSSHKTYYVISTYNRGSNRSCWLPSGNKKPCPHSTIPSRRCIARKPAICQSPVLQFCPFIAPPSSRRHQRSRSFSSSFFSFLFHRRNNFSEGFAPIYAVSGTAASLARPFRNAAQYYVDPRNYTKKEELFISHVYRGQTFPRLIQQ